MVVVSLRRNSSDRCINAAVFAAGGNHHEQARRNAKNWPCREL